MSVAISPNGKLVVSGAKINNYLYNAYSENCISIIQQILQDQPSKIHPLIIDILVAIVEEQVNNLVSSLQTSDYSLFQFKTILLTKKNINLWKEKDVMASAITENQYTFLNSFYQSFCYALVRSIDLINDTWFWLQIIEDIAGTAIDKNPNTKLLNADRWLKKVIVSKEVSHEDGYNNYQKEKATIEYMEDFQKALKPILDEWKTI